MKMIMTLSVQDSGRVRYVKCPGVVLEAGCVVARLELDDPSKVHAVCNTWSLQLWAMRFVTRGPCSSGPCGL